MNKNKIAIIGSVGVPAKYGGFETLVDNLLDILPQFYDVTVFCETKSSPDKLENYKGAKLYYLNLKANGFQSIIYDVVSIFKSFSSNDYLLLLGVSGAIVLPLIKPFYKGKIITNIDGLEWKRDKWKPYGRKFLKFSERIMVNYSDCIVADNRHIQKYVMSEYGKSSTFIGYGADHVYAVEPNEFHEKYPFIVDKYFCTVCRIEPENNIGLMINAYIDSGCSLPYIIVGNWHASDYGRSLLLNYKNFPNLHLFSPIYEPEELNALRSNCYFYLHGHSAGGTNPSLVEAMYLGLPILANDVLYNRATTFDHALYFSNKNDLIQLIKQVSEEGYNSRNDVGIKMKKVAVENYLWKNITLQYINVLKKFEENKLTKKIQKLNAD